LALVYILKNKINNKCYVGQTIQKINNRIDQHVSASYNGGKQLINYAIKKYGINNFKIETMDCKGGQESLNKLECDIIQKFNSMIPFGYNLKNGGHHGKYSKESKLKMSKSHEGVKLSEKHKKSIGKALKGKCAGKNHWAYGKKQTEEIKKKRIESRAWYKHSENTKRKLSNLKMGTKNPMYGMIGSKHHNSKKIVLIHPNEEKEHFGSLMDACRKYDIDVRNLSAVLVGKRNHHKGYKCKYNNEV
jgi:group I intron endonuclease